jgi:outer membrane murein-binding lipoprotein Lpp
MAEALKAQEATFVLLSEKDTNVTSMQERIDQLEESLESERTDHRAMRRTAKAAKSLEREHQLKACSYRLW